MNKPIPEPNEGQHGHNGEPIEDVIYVEGQADTTVRPMDPAIRRALKHLVPPQYWPPEDRLPENKST